MKWVPLEMRAHIYLRVGGMTRSRKVGGVSVYARGGSWAYLVEGPGDPLTGERQRAYRGGFRTSDEAWGAATDAKKRLDQGAAPHARRVRVRAFFDEWLEATRPSLKATTYASYRNMAEFYIYPILGNRWLSEVNVRTLNAFYRHLLDQGRIRSDTNTAIYDALV